MELSKDFKVSSKPVTTDGALKFAAELELAIGEIMAGKRKPANIPMEPMVALIQFARDNAVAKWTEWEGGECPVPVGTLVDVRHRDGVEFFAQPAGTNGGPGKGHAQDWHDDDSDADIVAYRISAVQEGGAA